MSKSFLLLPLLLLITHSARYNFSLTTWTFNIQNDPKQYKAAIPSTLSLDLIDNGLVSSNPYYRDNFLKFYDYETKDVTYQTNFSIAANLLILPHQIIIFQGLDTHAQVYLNDELILESHNMFRRYEVQVKFRQNNTLKIHFTSSVKYDLQRQAEFKQKYGFTLPANYSFTRKAGYQYGWDWGPRILTVGIWKNVNVQLYSDPRMKDIRFTHSPIDKKTTKIEGKVEVDVFHLIPTTEYILDVKVVKKESRQQIAKGQIPIKAQQSKHVEFLFNTTIDKETLWWTWDLGKPNMIDIILTLKKDTTEILSQSMSTGIRTVQVIQQSKQFNGTSFKFNLNGYDVYMRGGNYIPPEMSLARTNKSTYDKIAKDSLFGRFNMIRLWGGGQFEKDQFYSAMDEAGILIWHDLMFACALYPSSDEILKNIEAEMRDNVKRIRNHPSMGLWNGNNQIWIGWQEWGWKSGKTEEQKQVVQDMYNDVFKGVLAKVLEEQHPEVYYWETSPSVSSNSVKDISSGDIHFWRVWGGGTDIEEYQTYIGRFNSEYGIQSMPEISSIEQFTAPEDRNINSLILRLHQRHIFGDKYLPQYTYSYAGNTSNLTRYSYYSQVMQSYALQMAIVSLRLNKPLNMGSLYWQLNDVWPVSSWATVDYYGIYKAAHFRIRQVYEDLMIHTLHDVKSGDFIVYIVNQQNKTHFCRCVISIELFTGDATPDRFVIQKTVPPFERVLVRRLIKQDYQKYEKIGFIKTELKTTQNVVSSHNYFFVTMKSRPNYSPNLKFKRQGKMLTFDTDKVASYIWIYRMNKDRYIPLSLPENYFTMTANTTKSVEVGDVPENQLFVTCYEWQFQAQKKQQIKLTRQE